MNHYGRDNMRIYDAADFGRAVRTFRKAKGYTQQQIADLSGCSLMFVSNLERGKETAELGKALAVLATIGVDVRAGAGAARNKAEHRGRIRRRLILS